MKKFKFLTIILAAIAMTMCICACDLLSASGASYEISLNSDKGFILQVGDEVDFKEYFSVKDKNGYEIVITDDMLDLSEVDLSKPGMFAVTLKVGTASLSATFAVKTEGSVTPDPDPAGDDLDAVLQKYADSSKWNFAVTLRETYQGGTYADDNYEYLGNLIRNTYVAEDENTYSDYLEYVASSDTFYFYLDNGDGTYEKLEEGSYDFEEYISYFYMIDPSALIGFEYTGSNGTYTAKDANSAGNAVIGEYESYTWTKFEVTISGGQISKIVGVMNDGDTQEYIFSKYGKVSFTLPSVGGGSSTVTPPTPSGDTMEDQVYDASRFDSDTLQDKFENVGNDYIGLPSTGNFHALVIPVQFSGDTITQTQLDNLEKAFNGTASDTGWESVKSYYEKSSYGKLVLNFDIQSVYKAKYNASYYETQEESYRLNGQTYKRTGEEIILREVLAAYEKTIDLSQYDTNGDEIIDAVYLIYSAPVDYSEDSFYWAYVTWYMGEETYDNVGAYYYLFASFGFMDESTSRDKSSDYNVIPNLKINAATYIHETGHLFGLDDYYDYYEGTGSDEGLGGSDMMDYTIGDQNVYSKTMLGWLSPTVVNETKTVTIQSSQANASTLLIPLDFNNSYFCEYLLIDLYTAQGLNELHAKNAVTNDLILYGGAAYGVRIYHISSSIDDPYSDEYGSFTDNNNSISKNALIKLVEADGETKFKSTGGYAAEKDLWQQGDKLSEIFPSYTRNDGKKLNFDITIGSVTASSASITVTFL